MVSKNPLGAGRPASAETLPDIAGHVNGIEDIEGNHSRRGFRFAVNRGRGHGCLCYGLADWGPK